MHKVRTDTCYQITHCFVEKNHYFVKFQINNTPPLPPTKAENQNIPTVTILLNGEELQDPINSHALYLLHYLFLDAYTCITF